MLLSEWLFSIKSALQRRGMTNYRLRRKSRRDRLHIAFAEQLEDRTLLTATITGILDDTGISTADLVTNDTTLTVNGTATAGSTVTLTDNGITLSNTIAASAVNGQWSFSGTFAAGTHNLVAFDPATSPAGNVTVIVDTTSPTVTINQQSLGQFDPSNALTINFTAVFSEAVYGFTGSSTGIQTRDVVVATGSGTAFSTGTIPVVTVTPVGTARTTYTVGISGMNQNGTVTPSIVAGAAFDGAGNLSTASTSTDATVTFDSVAPSATIAEANGQVDPTTGTTVNYTVVFSESVTDFGLQAGDVTVATGGGTAFATATPNVVVTGNGTTYNVAISGMDRTGLVTPTVAAGAAVDAAGNTSTLAIATTGVGAAATVTIAGTPAIGDVYTVTINGTPVSFTATAATVANVTAGLTTAINSNATLAPVVTAADASPNVNITADFAGTSFTLSVSSTLVVGSTGTIRRDANVQYNDNIAPTVTSITLASANPTNKTGAGAGNAVSFLVTFSEFVTDIESGDFNLTQTGTVTTAAILSVSAATGSSVNVLVDNLNGDGGLRLNFGGGDGVLDQSGTGSTATFTTGQAYTVDHTAPTGAGTSVVLLNQSSTVVNFTVTFPEYVTDFNDAADVTYTGAPPGGVVTITPATVTGNGKTFNLAISGMTANGNVSISVNLTGVADLAGNAGTGTANSPVVAYADTVAPTVVSVVPTGTTPTGAATVAYLVTFDEPVAVVSNAAFVFTTTSGTFGIAPSLNGVAGAGSTRTVTINTGTPSVGTNAGFRLDVTAGTNITDTKGNNLATGFSTATSYTIDKTLPSATVTLASGQSASHNSSAASTGSTVNFTVTFNEAVTGFDASDIVLGGSLASSISASQIQVTPSGGVLGTVFNVAVINIANNGTLTATVNASAATDAAANVGPSSASAPSSTVTFTDGTLPRVTSIVRQTPTVQSTNATGVTYRITFSEVVFGVDTSDLQLTSTGGITGASITGVNSLSPPNSTQFDVTVNTGTGNGTLRLDLLDNNTITDFVGNFLGGVTSTDGTFTSGESYTIDKTGPTVTINQAVGQADPVRTTPSDTVNFSVVFSEAVTGFDFSDVTLGGAAAPAVNASNVIVTGSGTLFNVAVTNITAEGFLTATIGAGVATDAASNSNVASTTSDNQVTIDNTGPTVTSITPVVAGPVTTNPIQFTVTFNGPVLGLDASAIVIGGTATGNRTATVSGTGTTFTVSVSGVTGSGTVNVTVPANVTSDLAGNRNTGSVTSANVTFNDQVGPSVVSIVPKAGNPNPTNATSVVFTVTLDEDVTGVSTGDFQTFSIGTFTGAVAVTGVSQITPRVFDVTASSGTGAGDLGTIRLDLIDDNSILDLAGNPLGGPGQQNFVGAPPALYNIDRVAPTVTINQAGSQSDPTSTSPINFTVVFSESVSGFATADVTLGGTAGATTATVTGSGSTYNVSVSGMTGTGTVTATIAGGVATDAAGNNNAGSTSSDNSVTFNLPADTTAPTVNSSVKASADPNNTASVNFTVTFSEPVDTTTVGNADFTVNAPALTGTSIGSVTPVGGAGFRTTFTVAVNTGTGSGSLQLRITDDDTIVDAAGNRLGGTGAGNGNFTTGESYTIDKTAPAPTLGLAAGQSSTHLSQANGSTINFAVNFGESVTGFDAADISFATSTAPGTLVATVTPATGAAYNVAVTGMTGSGNVVVGFAAGAANDLATNASAAPTPTTATVAYTDNTPPTVLSSVRMNADPPLATASSVAFLVTFSEGVTGVGLADFTLVTTGAISGAAISSVTSVTSSTYTVVVGTGSGDGTIRLDVVDDDTIQDSSTNRLGGTGTGNGAFTTGQFYTIDTTAPSVSSINRRSGTANPTTGGVANTVEFTVTFSEAVTGVDTSDFAPPAIAGFSGGAVGALTVIPVSSSVYTVTVNLGTLTGVGSVRIDLVDDNSITDQANNALVGIGAGPPPVGSRIGDQIFTVDKVGPTVTINQAAGQADPTGASPINFTTVFDEGVSGFTASDVTLSNGAGTVTGSISSTSQSSTISVIASGALTATTQKLFALINGTLVTYTVTATDAGLGTNAERTAALGAGLRAAITAAGLGISATDNGAGVITLTSSSSSFSVYAHVQVTAPATPVTMTTATTLSYNVAVTGMTLNGTVTASILAGAASDAAGNMTPLATSVDPSVTFQDLTNPAVVSLNRAASDPTNSTSVTFTVTFDTSVTGVNSSGANADFSLTTTGTIAGASVASMSGSGTTYTVTVNTGTGEGTIRLNVVDNDSIIEASGNPLGGTGAGNGSFTTGQTYTIDRTGPTATINQAAGQGDPTNSAPINFTVVFSETVADFATGDVTLSGTAGATTATVTGSGTTYNVAVTGMTGSGTVTAAITAGVATDAAGNANAIATSSDATVTFNNNPITVTIDQASSQVDPTNGSSISFSVVFAQSVTGFTSSDVSLTGSTATGTLSAAVTGSGTNYTVTVTGMSGSGTVVATIPSGAAMNSIGNASAASTSTDNSVTFDNVVPTVTMNQAASQADPTNSTTINYIVTFSELVSGFTASDVVLSGTAGATTAVVTGSGANYNVAVFGMTSSGTVIASVAANAAVDAAGNPNSASTFTDRTVTFDNQPPTVTVNQAVGQIDPTNVGTITFTAVFSEPVTGFTNSDVGLGGTAGATTAVVTGSGTTYNIAVTGMTSVGTVIATIGVGAAFDAAGNGNSASTGADNQVTFDNAQPSVTITQASGQADPSNSSIINFTVTFSESVTGFTNSDVTLAGTAGATTAAVTGAGAVYNVAVSGMSTSGAVTMSIPAGAAADAAGNISPASINTDNTVTYDNVTPTVTVNQATGQTDPTNSTTLNFTVTFSESVTGFTNSDVVLAGTAGANAVVISGAGSSYIIAVSGMTSPGTVIVSIGAGAAFDAAGNGNTASTSTDNTMTFDNAGPTVTVNQAAGQSDPTNTSPINFTVVFSETVTGFTPSDVILGGTAGPATAVLTTSDNRTFSIVVSGMSQPGTVTMSIGANAAFDAVGNPNLASTTTDSIVTFDNVAPTVTILKASGQADPTRQSPVNFSVVFSEPVTGFAVNDLTIQLGAGLSGSTSAVVTGTGSSYNVAVSGGTGVGTLSISVNASAATDTTGNASLASAPASVTIDTVAPGVTIAQAVGQADPTNASTINFGAVFTEPVTGFDASDVQLSGTAGASTVVVTTTDNRSFNLAVSGMVRSGSVQVSVPAGAATDAAINANLASTSADNSVVFDNVAPSVTINQASGQADPTRVTPLSFSVLFSEAVTGFGPSDVSVATTGTLTGSPTVSVVGNGAAYTVAIAGVGGTGTGVVTVSIPAGIAIDSAGNGNLASMSTDNSVAMDATSPTVVINQAAGQPDPTSAIPLTFTVVFSEPVSGFSPNDLVVSTTGTLTGTPVVTVSGSDANYSVVVSGIANSGSGTVSATIPAGIATDAVGNTNIASTSTDNTVTLDFSGPTVTVNQATGQQDPTVASPVNFSVVFSEPVSGFTAIDVFLSGTAPGNLTANVTGSGSVYNVAVSGMTGNGTVIAAVAAGAASDALGNGNAASTSTDNTITFNVVPASSRFYRTYNPNADFHFFTASSSEFNFVKMVGNRDEATGNSGFGVSPTSVSATAKLLRIYITTTGAHYYTTNPSELAFLVSIGNRDESHVNAGFVWTTQIPGTVEIFRLFNRTRGVHLFTTNVNEKNGILAAFPGVWEQHSSLGFGVPHNVGVFTTGGAIQIPARRAAASHDEPRQMPACRWQDSGIPSLASSSAPSDLPTRLLADVGSQRLASAVERLFISDVPVMSLASCINRARQTPLVTVQQESLIDDFWNLVGAEPALLETY